MEKKKRKKLKLIDTNKSLALATYNGVGKLLYRVFRHSHLVNVTLSEIMEFTELESELNSNTRVHYNDSWRWEILNLKFSLLGDNSFDVDWLNYVFDFVFGIKIRKYC